MKVRSKETYEAYQWHKPGDLPNKVHDEGDGTSHYCTYNDEIIDLKPGDWIVDGDVYSNENFQQFFEQCKDS